MEKSETFQYVPLIENIQWLLQNRDVYEEVSTIKYTSIIIIFCECIVLFQIFKTHTNNSEYMYDFSDGQIYKEHPLFSKDHRALQLIMYTDEVETANPLGSYRGQHKLSKVFLSDCYYMFDALNIIILF